MYFLYSAIPTGPLLMALYSIILINKKILKLKIKIKNIYMDINR